VGTNHGLHYYENGKHKEVFKIKDGLPNNVINSMLEDSKGNLWLGTMKGLSKFNLERKTFNNFDTADGLLSNEFKPNSCFKNKDGVFFFGSIGVNMFHPDSIRINTYRPNVFITDLKIINNDSKLKRDSTFWKNINERKEISLTATNNYFTIHYVHIDSKGLVING
jgi:hypothetical protein